MKLEHIVRFTQGHDCIRFECRFGKEDCKPGWGGSHGRGGLEIRFVAKGEKGAVQFLLLTGWMPQFCEKDRIGVRDIRLEGRAIPADLGYHSPKPIYKDQVPISDSCEWVDDGPCYYDGSGLNANDPMYALVNGGDEALWAFLDAYYEHVFGDAEYPTPAEYPMPLRQGSD